MITAGSRGASTGSTCCFEGLGAAATGAFPWPWLWAWPCSLPLLSWPPQQSCNASHQDDASPKSLTNETDALSDLDAIHSLAAFEQGDWLAELDLLQLASALRQTASEQGFYEGRLFDLMIAIADVLETDHGWDLEQADAWLDRMGLWDEQL